MYLQQAACTGLGNQNNYDDKKQSLDTNCAENRIVYCTV